MIDARGARASNRAMDLRTLRPHDARFLLGVLFPAMTTYSVLMHPATAWIGAVAIWWGMALAEAFFPSLARSPAPARDGTAMAWLLRVFVPLEFVLLGAGLYRAADADWPVLLSVVFCCGFVAGAQGISFAHELGHSRKRFDRALGWILMTLVNYPQFMVEHYRGHHVRAATHDDPASARSGESLWRFLPRTLGGSLRGAWRLERLRLAQRRKSWIASPLLWCTLANVAFIAALAGFGQWKMLAFWLLQSAWAVWLLETVNYIEHYGLQRRAGADGRPEPFAVHHAWNADHVLSNSVLANLQRHSDHHMHAWKPYAELEALPGPQLPTGYAGCIVLAAIPPLWFSLMHARMRQPQAPVAAGDVVLK